MEIKDWKKAEAAMKWMNEIMNDPSIPKNYTSVYTKEFYEKNAKENQKKM